MLYNSLMRYIKVIILSILVIASLNTALSAHDWYPYDCCSEKDCHPIPCEAIKEQGKNLVYNGYTFFEDMIKPSLDGQCHVCISNEVPNPDFTPFPHCIFIQQNS